MTTNIQSAEHNILLATKLSIPPARSDLIVRPRLFRLLEEGIQQKLTLLSAAAGFGKTTILQSWIQARTELAPAIAWVSLDASENDPTLFWKYMVTSLETVQPKISNLILPLLNALQPPPIEVMLTVLINAVTQVSQNFVLILDEYQLIDTPTIHQALSFLLDHLPPQMHIILASRIDPPLPLARLRASGQLTEIRTNELRFTAAETQHFLQQENRPLSSEQVQALGARTEGWITGLHLAALALRKCEHESDFIAAFTGSNRYILDYLIEEVLSRQPVYLQDFLLQTSLLERLNGSLCDAITEQHNGQLLLEQLEDANLFLVPLDSQRSWYRYHKLFAEVLRQRLQRTSPEHVPRLSLKAASWYAQNGLMIEAVETALKGQHFEYAASIIDNVNAAMMKRGETATLLRWIQLLPAQIVHAHLSLCLCYAWVLYLSVQFDASETYITKVEALLANTQEARAQRPSRPEQIEGEIAALRAVIAISRQDIPHVLTFAQRALQQLPLEDRGGRALVTWALGVAYWFNDDVEAACNTVAQSITLESSTDSPFAVLNALGDLVQLQIARGQLRQAEKTCQQGRQFVERHAALLPATNTMQIAYGELQREWNALEHASDLLNQGLEQASQTWNLGNTLRGSIALARTKQALGNTDGSQAAIKRAEQIATEHHLPHLVSIVRAYKARLLLLQGEYEEAGRWARDSMLSSADEQIHHTREVEYLTLARVCLAQNKAGEALPLLIRLLHMAERGKRTGSVIEILALTALAHEKQGNRTTALAQLGRALACAEPEGYIRMFADEGLPMARLLKHLLEQPQGQRTQPISSLYMLRLLQALETPLEASDKQDSQTALVEPLSTRECEVLYLLASGSSNREIAETLIVSLGTVKKHLNNIFGKLGVTNRTRAIARAKNLGLLP